MNKHLYFLLFRLEYMKKIAAFAENKFVQKIAKEELQKIQNMVNHLKEGENGK